MFHLLSISDVKIYWYIENSIFTEKIFNYCKSINLLIIKRRNLIGFHGKSTDLFKLDSTTKLETWSIFFTVNFFRTLSKASNYHNFMKSYPNQYKYVSFFPLDIDIDTTTAALICWFISLLSGSFNMTNLFNDPALSESTIKVFNDEYKTFSKELEPKIMEASTGPRGRHCRRSSILYHMTISF